MYTRPFIRFVAALWAFGWSLGLLLLLSMVRPTVPEATPKEPPSGSLVYLAVPGQAGDPPTAPSRRSWPVLDVPAQGRTHRLQPVTQGTPAHASPGPVDPRILPQEERADHAPVGPQPAIPATGGADRVAPPQTAASAPLRLDALVIREAHRSSKSETRRMAETSGAWFGDRTITPQERLARQVEDAAKPECLPLSNGGGSLLSLPVAVYLKLRDQCN